ncbi:hypothetical protein [uncultured Tistrella sp.]|uniref:hypothetical protein n=1 Tax=Tistrella mobilis TaxID=171437 RepID=UPI00262E9C76|nr:hypothetical protein [uncultured Tistrella sp.]
MTALAVGDLLSQTPAAEIVLAGCGLRGMGLLTATPALLDHRLTVIDAGPRPGPGAFPGYRIQSNSTGSDFFGWVDPAGPFGPVLDDPAVRRLREHRGAFDLALLAGALDRFGDRLATLLPPDRLIREDPLAHVTVDKEAIGLTLASGRRIDTRALVLALGITEPAHDALAPWAARTIPSGRIVRDHLAALPPLPADRPVRIVIAGGSHSAYSAALVLADAVDAGRLSAEVTILHRGPARLFYPDMDTRAAEPHDRLEAVPDPARDICPETGQIFRYSGLRHRARALFREIAQGARQGFTQRQIPAIDDAAALLDQADLIVQALGYRSRRLAMTIDGRPWDPAGGRAVVRPEPDGRIPLPAGARAQIFVMGMDPYPYDDGALTPTGQYALRGGQILAALARPPAAGQPLPLAEPV